MFVGQLSLSNNICVSFCATDKIKHCFDGVIREVTGDFFFFVVLVKVVQFNRERAAPDVSQEEHSLNYSTTSLPTETGFRYTDSLSQTLMCFFVLNFKQL